MNRENKIVYDKSSAKQLLNLLSNDEKTYVLKNDLIKNNTINFVGYLELDKVNIISLPFLFRNMNHTPEDIELIVKTIKKGRRMLGNLFTGLVVDRKEQIANEFHLLFANHGYPKDYDIDLNTTGGKISGKQTFHGKNLLLLQNKFVFKKFYYYKNNRTYSFIKKLIDAFLFYECDVTTKNPTDIDKSFFKTEANIVKLNKMLATSNNELFRKYINLMIGYIKSYINSETGNCFTTNYNLIWELMVNSYVNTLGNYKYQFNMNVGTWENKGDVSVSLDHFDDVNNIIIDSKYKKKETIMNSLDYKQLFYQYYLQEQTGKQYENILVIPTLESSKVIDKFSVNGLNGLFIELVQINFFDVVKTF